MPNIIEITDFHAPELDPYARLTQNQLRNRLEPEKGIFIAESPKVIDRALDECGVWYCGGKNSPYIWLRCPGNMKSWEFFDWLLENCGVVGTPGVGFGECGEGYFRLTAFGDAEKTKVAAERIKTAIKAL